MEIARQTRPRKIFPPARGNFHSNWTKIQPPNPETIRFLKKGQIFMITPALNYEITRKFQTFSRLKLPTTGQQNRSPAEKKTFRPPGLKHKTTCTSRLPTVLLKADALPHSIIRTRVAPTGRAPESATIQPLPPVDVAVAILTEA